MTSTSTITGQEICKIKTERGLTGLTSDTMEDKRNK